VKLIESGVIVEYLEDAFHGEGPDLRPSHPREAAAVRMFNEAYGYKC